MNNDHIDRLKTALAESREREKTLRAALGRLVALYEHDCDTDLTRPKWLQDALNLCPSL